MTPYIRKQVSDFWSLCYKLMKKLTFLKALCVCAVGLRLPQLKRDLKTTDKRQDIFTHFLHVNILYILLHYHMMQPIIQKLADG